MHCSTTLKEFIMIVNNYNKISSIILNPIKLLLITLVEQCFFKDSALGSYLNASLINPGIIK